MGSHLFGFNGLNILLIRCTDDVCDQVELMDIVLSRKERLPAGRALGGIKRGGPRGESLRNAVPRDGTAAPQRFNPSDPKPRPHLPP